MSRFARFAFLVALAAILAWPHPVQAAPPDRTEVGGTAASQGWLAQLWAPLARLFGASGVGPTKDPDGQTEAPTVDPNGLSVRAGWQSAEDADEGPTMDPNGATGSSGQEGDVGPGMDPDG